MARSKNKRTLKDTRPDTLVPAPLRGPSRRVLLVVCLLLTFGVTFAYTSGDTWAIVLYRLLADGGLLAIWLLAAAGFGLAVLRVLPLRDRESTDVADREMLLHVVTATAVGLGIISLLTLGLGLAGWLNRVSSFAMLGIGGVLGVLYVLLGGLRNREAIDGAIRDWLSVPAGWSWLWLLAMPFLGTAIVVALVPPGFMWLGEPHGYDVVEYHLQIPREWYEIGRIVPLHHNVFSFFPFNVEMHYLLAMHLHGGPWAGMYLAHFMHLTMVVLCVAAVYGFARRLALSHAVATIASVAVATVPWMTQLGTIAYNEGGLLLFGTLAMGWAFRATISPARRFGRFPVAGLLAGFACGSKLTAVPEILLAVTGIVSIAILLTRNATSIPARLRLTGIASFFLAGMLAFSPWLVRNVAWAGNPIFPEATAVFGKGHFSDSQVERWKQAHAPRPDQRPLASRQLAWLLDVWTSPQYGYVLLPLGLLSAVAVDLELRKRNQAAATAPPGDTEARSASRAPDELNGPDESSASPDHHSQILKNLRMMMMLLFGMFIALSIVWLGFTHLQGRFFILGVPIAGLMVAGLPPKRWMVAAAGCAVMAGGFLGYWTLHSTVAGLLVERKANLVLGAESLSYVLPAVIAEALETEKPIVLVGDAKAFYYGIPMSRLSYRTVFDVDAQPGESVIDAWSRGTPADAIRVVDPNELRRFNETYRAIPPIPADLSERTEPVVIGHP